MGCNHYDHSSCRRCAGHALTISRGSDHALLQSALLVLLHDSPLLAAPRPLQVPRPGVDRLLESFTERPRVCRVDVSDDHTHMRSRMPDLGSGRHDQPWRHGAGSICTRCCLAVCNAVVRGRGTQLLVHSHQAARGEDTGGAEC